MKVLILLIMILNVSIFAFENQYVSCTLYKVEKSNKTEYISKRQARSQNRYHIPVSVTELKVKGIPFMNLYTDSSFAFSFKKMHTAYDEYETVGNSVFVFNDGEKIINNIVTRDLKYKQFYKCVPREKSFEETAAEKAVKIRSWFK